MSLLMQALKKAERAKQNHLPDEELSKPSEAFDQVLELAPQEPARSDPLSLSPLGLSPLDAQEAEPALEFTAPVHEAIAIEPRIEDVAPLVPPLHAAEAPPKRARNAPAPPPPPRIRPKKRSAPYLTARTMRLGALGGALALVAGVFGYMYWNAMYGSGSSRNLAPVPMPGQNAPSAAAPTGSADLVVAPPSIEPPSVTAADAAQAYAPMAAAPLAPPPAAAAAAPPVAAAPSSPPDSRNSGPPEMYMPPSTMPSAAAPAALSGGDSANIRVARASVPGQVNPGVQSGFTAVQGGDLAGARQQYQGVLREEENNRDALLGLAAIAVRESHPEQANALYGRLLEIDPGDTDALAGLAGLRSANSTQLDGQLNARLRQALERAPESGPLLFALGNLYARQQRWPEAQQHYFRAYTAAPTNADYAFNLAVGLDRLNQGKLALTYYQRALELSAGGSVSFDSAGVTQRVRELGGQ